MSKQIAIIPLADISRAGMVEAKGRSMAQVQADEGCDYILNSYFFNRPLTKLDKAVKVADGSNQRKAKCKTVSAIAVALREDTKSFDKADNVFNKDTVL